MRVRTIRIVAMAFLVACGSPLLLYRNGTQSDLDKGLRGSGLGSVETLEANYNTWEEEYLKNGGDRNMVMSMGWSKGLSTAYTDAHGQAKLNLVDGTVSVEIHGLSAEKDWDVWLIDNLPGPGRTVMPEPGDTMLDLGRLKHERGSAKLEANLGSEVFANNEWEIVAVTPAGKNPSEDRVILGMTTFFHRLYLSKQRGQFGVLSDEPAPPALKDPSLWTRLVEFLSPTAEAQIGPNPNPNPNALEQSIARGRSSFFTQTFEGNGRTCGTCHRENNNLTIDPPFIATLPPNDPLFVAEFTPALSANFENPALMRSQGLILENVDGVDDLANKFVMRGVPHTLALLQNTLTPAPGTPTPPNQMTGWGGDGAPGSGTLRDFITGAIFQHYPKTLARAPGVDFRMPTDSELDDLEAFQKSLGRPADLDLSALSLKSTVASQGQAIFTDAGKGRCNTCHFNAGASSSFNPPGRNRNFNTNVEGLTPHPGPPDGGFGRTGTSPNGGIGNGTFNTPVLVEAADTGPFFHNNAVATIEAAVAFYTGPEFNSSPAGGITLTPTEIAAVAAFLRAINALENIRSSIDLEQRAKSATSFPQVEELLKLAISEIEDAIEVLDGAGLHPKAQSQLRVAAEKAGVVKANQSTTARNALIDDSLGHINAAKSEIVN